MKTVEQLIEILVSDKSIIQDSADHIREECIIPSIKNWFIRDGYPYDDPRPEDIESEWDKNIDYFCWMTGEIFENHYSKDPAGYKEYLDIFFEPWPGPGEGMAIKQEYIPALQNKLHGLFKPHILP